jgi:transposase
MLQLTPQSRVFLAREPADFRRGIDGLAALCRQQLGEDPMGGAIFVFRNRRGTSLKLLCYDLGEPIHYVKLPVGVGRYARVPGSLGLSNST